MKMTSIIKTVASVAAIVTVGKVVYDKVKTNKATETEEVKTTVDEVVEDDEPEPNIIEKVGTCIHEYMTEKQLKTVCVAGAVTIGVCAIIVNHRITKSKAYEIKVQKIYSNINDYMINMNKQMVDLDPKAYEMYLKLRPFSDMFASCCYYKALSNGLLTHEQIEQITHDVYQELTKDVYQEVA